MIVKAIQETISYLTHKPVLWIPGLYAGIIVAIYVWLELSGSNFLAEKIGILALILFPYFMGLVNYTFHVSEFKLKTTLAGGLKTFFPIILPFIILAGVIVILMILFSIPLTIMGFGQDPYTLSGMIMGLMIPTLFISWYIDNIAVCEGTGIKETFKRSMILCSSDFFATLGCILMSCLVFILAIFLGALIWGIALAERFTPYLSMNMTVQKETFSNFTLTDWQALIGHSGMIITALISGLMIFLLIPFILVFKYQCYNSISHKISVIYGEYDEKGRWFKY